MAHSTIWGLDIGNSAIKGVKMVRSGSEARIVDFDIIDIQGGDEVTDRVARVQAALGTLCSNHSFGSDAVYLSLSGDLCLFKEFQLPPGSESKLEDLVLYEAKQQIPFPLDQVEMGWERYDEASGGGVELIAVRKTIIDEILALTDNFKLNVQGITVAPLALFNFIKYEFQPQGPTLILDAGYKGTDFVVMNGRQMYSRTIPIAGREITRVLENKFKVAFDKAEELKKNIGQSKQADKILSVIEPTLRQLGAEIQRTIGFYKSKSRGQKLNHAYLLGHTFRLPRMADTMANQVREAPFTIVEGVRRIVLDRVVNPGVFANEFPTMAVAIGLGVQGLGLSELSVNLLPAARKTQIKVKSKQLWAALSTAAILAALWVSYDRAVKENESAETLKVNLDAALKDVKTQQEALDAATKPLPMEQKHVEQLARIGRDRGRLQKIFKTIAGLKGPDDKPFFGDHRQIYLSNLYVSREPFTATPPANWKENVALNNERHRDVTQAILAPLYAPMKNAVAEWDGPPELRPDFPLVVVLSGECPEQDLQKVLGEDGDLLKALKTVPEVQHINKDTHSAHVRTESRPSLNWLGQPAENPVAGTPNEMRYNAFHVIFRWLDREDPDLEPKPVVAEAPAAPKARK